jgi:hypothetical protein
MRAIISTKYLAERLYKALQNKGFNQIEFKDKEWVLNRTEKPSLSISVDYTRDSSREFNTLQIDRVQWFKLYQFVKILPEQPIVLEISDYGNDEIKIRLCQFVADF